MTNATATNGRAKRDGGSDTHVPETPIGDTAIAKPNVRVGRDGQRRGCGVAGRSGPPRENRNAYRHGLACGKLGKGQQYIEKRVNALRREIEDAVLASKGEISRPASWAINTAMKWEAYAMRAADYLRKKGDALSPADQLRFAEAIPKASERRDAALRSLGLDAPQQPPWVLDVPAADSGTDLEEK
jgi:hypothetical protein